MRFSTIFTALFCPYIALERTAQNLDYVSSLVALRSRAKSDFKDRTLIMVEKRIKGTICTYFN